MIAATDFLILPYTSDLTEAGIAYACRSLAYTYDRMGGSQAARLRRIVAGIAAELAFRRHLSAMEIPHDLLGATPFTHPDRYDLAFGGRRCDLKSFLIYNRARIREVRKSPAALLDAAALIPVDQFASDHLHEEDLYIFAFVLALIAPHSKDLQRALAAEQPVCLLHPLPEGWARPQLWRPLGQLILKTELQSEIALEIGGQRPDRQFQVERLEIPPGRQVRSRAAWNAVSYLSLVLPQQTPELPAGRVGIFSPVLAEAHIVQPRDWVNIWVYGMEITLAGYITRGEFRRRARRIPAGGQVFQYPRTRTDNLAVPIASLHPLSDLFARARAWASANPSEA